MIWLADLAALVAGAGMAQAALGHVALRRFHAGSRHPQAPSKLPPVPLPSVTVLKPLCGDEPMLEAALASVCAQDYPAFQIVFGVQHAADPALQVIARVRGRFPGVDIAVVADATPHGVNRKVANLINMFPAAKHDVLVIADSDVHCPPDYLASLVLALRSPGTGLATTVYAGLAAKPSPAASLGASWITHSFLPGVLLSRCLGRRDCLGASMALRRETLAAIGGLPALADHIGDDHVLGQLVKEQGLAIRLAAAVPATTVPETTLAEVFRHELRWSRTVLSLAPAAFPLWAIQFPIFWAMLAMALSGGAAWTLGLFLLAWAARGAAAHGVDRTLGLAASGRATPVPFWLLPLRDLMSITVILASYGGDQVEWRGRTLRTGHPAGPAPSGPPAGQLMEPTP